MDDLEIVRRCARAMSIDNGRVTVSTPYIDITGGTEHRNHLSFQAPYDPLHDDAQMVALVKRFGLSISSPTSGDLDRNHYVAYQSITDGPVSKDADLNRAVCECIAKMERAKNG